MQTNATTSTFMTDFYVDTVEEVEFALEHLIKGISIPVFTSEDIEVTKPPIYQEIRMRNDEIGRTIYKSHTRNMLQNYSYVDGLGSIKDVESFSYDLVRFCYDTFYQPKNEILFIAGNFEVNDLYRKIEEIYKELSFKEVSFTFPNIKEPKEVRGRYEEIKMPTSKDFVNISYKLDFSTIPLEERRMLTYYIGIFLEMNFSTISPLYKELIDEKIMDTALSYNFNYFKDYMLLSVCGNPNDEERFIKRIQEVFLKDRVFKEEVFNLDLKQEKMQFV